MSVEPGAPPPYDPFMPEVVEGDPYPIYRRLRDETPRLFLPAYDAWFFSRFEDVWNLSKEKQLSVESGITTSQLLLGGVGNPLMVSQMDPPQHTVYRNLLNELFKPAAATALDATIGARAAALLAPIRARGGGDMMEDFGSPLAAEVGCLLSGLPRADVALQIAWNRAFFDREPGRRGDTDTGARTYVEILDYVRERMQAVRRGAEPAAGTLGLLLAAQRDDPAISDEHIACTVFNMQIAAGDTVPKAVAAALWHLWRDPAQQARLLQEPALALPAFLEGARIDMPTQMQGRVATAAFDVGECRIEPGQRCMFLFASANRDEREFEAPDSYRIDREPRRTLAFGNGIHRCLGVHVAQVEGGAALREIARTLPPWRVDEAGSRRYRTEFLKGWAVLRIEF